LFDDFGKQSQAVIYPSLNGSLMWTEAEKLSREKTMLGFFVSGHPLLKFEHEINEFANVHFGDVNGFKGGSTAKACGIVTAVKKKIDKRGNTMAFVEMEDFSGKAECIVFSDAYAKYEQFLHPEAMVMVSGKGEVNGELLKIIVAEVYPMEKVREKFTKSIILSIHVNEIQENTITELRALIEKSKGNCSCYFNVVQAGANKMYHTRKYAVEPSDAFVVEAKKILGPQSVRFSA
jgi:DNA polymerase-3 subunit alpha